MTSVTPFQAVPAGPPPPPTSAGIRVPLWNPVPSFLPRRPCLSWLNLWSTGLSTLSSQCSWPRSGGKFTPLVVTSNPAPAQAALWMKQLPQYSQARPVVWTPLWGAASGLTRPAGGGMVIQAASHAVPPPQRRNPCAPSPAVRTLLPCSGSPRTTGQAAAWLRSRKPWWPRPPRCPRQLFVPSGRSFVFRLSLSSEPRLQVPFSTAGVRIPGCQGAGRAEGGWEAQPGEALQAASSRPLPPPKSPPLSPFPAYRPLLPHLRPRTRAPSPSPSSPPSPPIPPRPSHSLPHSLLCLRSSCSAPHSALP